MFTPTPDEGIRSILTYAKSAHEMGGRHRRAADSPLGPTAIPGRWSERIAVAEQGLRDSQRSAIAVGADPDLVEQVFAVARDWLAEALACTDLTRRELALASFEHDEAHKMLRSAVSESGDSQPVLPDMHGLTPWPNPGKPRSAAEFVSTLRMYHVYAGQPSYRVMQRRINSRFAASTLHTALHSDKLPSLEMVQAIISACQGTAEHQKAYSEAWRFLAMSHDQVDSRPSSGGAKRPRPFYSVSESA